MADNDSTCPSVVIESSLNAQLILITVSLAFQLFQAFVTGMKLRVKCRHCLCSVKPKGSSPSPDDSTASPSPCKTGSISLKTITVQK